MQYSLSKINRRNCFLTNIFSCYISNGWEWQLLQIYFKYFEISCVIHNRCVIPDKNNILQLSQYRLKFQPSPCIIIKNNYLPGTKQPMCKYKIPLSNVSFQSITVLYYCHFSLHFRNIDANYRTNLHQFYSA